MRPGNLASADGPGTVLDDLQRWYISQCDGEWEHRRGIRIETLDNPGWLVTIELDGTPLKEAAFTPIERADSEREWLNCSLGQLTFQGAGRIARTPEEDLQVATPEQMQASMIENLPAKTGKSLEEWMEIVRNSGLEKHGQVVSELKSRGVSHGYANLIAHLARQASPEVREAGGAPADAKLVANQYAGKEDLRPIYDELVRIVTDFGRDVEISPKKTYVSLRRSRQFGLLQPSTKTRLDVGLKLVDVAAGERLEPAGSWNSMVTHRVRVSSIGDVNDELAGWLRQAYDRG